MIDVLKGKYKIVREIARSNDIVYEAVDTALGRRIALKELNVPSNLVGQARRERIERFSREARAAGRLSHPNIVSIYEFGEENGRHFIAMEYLEGQNLRDMMQVRGVLPLKEAVDIACHILDALAYAHSNRVIHRDIKPDNIHILPGGQVKLTDFGIARLTEEPSLTSNGQVFGTPSYMSPEQIIGGDIDFRSDLFSLGIVLYEMLAGRKPFTGDSVVSITYAIMNAEPPPLTGVPTGIEQVIRRALAKQPAQRQASAEQMKQDLRNAEQTPSIFFTPGSGMTNLGMTGMGYGYQGAGATGNLPPANYAPPPPTQYAPPPVPNNGQPWAWNNPGQGAQNAPQQPVPQITPGQFPYGWTQPPAQPLFKLSPGGRTMLLSLLAAIVLGSGIALGIVAFTHSYDQYQKNVVSQRVGGIINQGVTAYNNRDYATAVQRFLDALNANPTTTEREAINYNLTATYVQLARAAEANGKLDEARDTYKKALAVTPDSKTAHDGLAGVLERMGDPGGARQERAAAQGSQDDGGTPDALKEKAPSGDPNAFMNARRQQAQQLINEGVELYKQGDRDGARAKWREAIGTAPATPERDKAQSLLDQTESSTPDFGAATDN